LSPSASSHPPPPPTLSSLSLHDALPISLRRKSRGLQSISRKLSRIAPRMRNFAYDPNCTCFPRSNLCNASINPTTPAWTRSSKRSEEHTSELQSRRDLVCRLLLEKKKKF